MPSCGRVAALLRPAGCGWIAGPSLDGPAAAAALSQSNPGRCCRRSIWAATSVKTDEDEVEFAIDANQSLLPETGTRARKRRASSPSRALIDALGRANKQHALPPKLTGRVDLSYMNAYRRDSKRYTLELERNRLQIGRRRNTPRQSLQTITSSYILKEHAGELAGLSHSPHSEGRNVASLFTADERDFLRVRRYNFQDVAEWARIITQKDAEAAAKIMLLHVARKAQNPVNMKPLPTFVALFLMRRPLGSLNSAALRNILTYTWQQLHRMSSRKLFDMGLLGHWEHIYPTGWSTFPTINESALYILIVRLIRHARHVYPEALVTIAAMIPQAFGLSTRRQQSPENERNNDLRLNRITVLYNKTLSLLAVPSRVRPLHSVAYYQRAQFDLLAAMEKHDPPLAITREGYRAIISVQLMNKKTEKEREWVRLKSKSWPPWKEDKTGLDALKGPEDGRSRAMEVLQRAREAGYGGQLWEQVAQIYTGWDTDLSPTIQTRAVLLHNSVSTRELRISLSSKSLSEKSKSESSALWAARIRTTRTVQEAWACFLGWEDCKEPPTEDVYLAMLEKVAFEAERRKRRRHDPGLGTDGEVFLAIPDSKDAGDLKEVFPIPVSPREATYVRTQPPSFNELAEKMFASGIRPGSETLSFLLAHAERLEDGLNYLARCSQKESKLKCLLSPDLADTASLKRVHNHIIAAYVALLCKFPSRRRSAARLFDSVDGKPRQMPETLRLWRHFLTQRPLEHAVQLLRAAKPKIPRAYHVLIETMAYLRRPLPLKQIYCSTPIQWIERFHLTQPIVEMMEQASLQPDLETFTLQCRALERAIFGALEILKNDDNELPSPSLGAIGPDAIQNVLGGGVFVRHWFNRLVSVPDAAAIEAPESQKDSKMPSLLATPDPATLHSYVRVLGLLCDWVGLHEVVEWVANHQEELTFRVGWAANDYRMMRKVLTAVRVFLERSWLEPLPNGRLRPSAAPQRHLDKIKAEAERLSRWGGWASEEEVAEYCSFIFADFPDDSFAHRSAKIPRVHYKDRVHR